MGFGGVDRGFSGSAARRSMPNPGSSTKQIDCSLYFFHLASEKA